MAQSWNIWFTLNNYTDDEQAAIVAIPNQRYRIVCKELCPTTGTPHLHGYIELSKKISVNKMHNLIRRWNADPRHGSQAQAIEYIKKGGDFEEFGEKKSPGKRKDIDLLRSNLINEDHKMREVVVYGNLQHIKIAEKYLEYLEEQRTWKTHITWIYGPSGAGKSRMARERLEDEDVYVKNTGTKWWAGYDGHNAVIIDDFRDSWWSLTYMLGLLDRYSFLLETKGGHRQFLPHYIVVTTIKEPKRHYTGTGEDIFQLLRRIDETILITEEQI